MTPILFDALWIGHAGDGRDAVRLLDAGVRALALAFRHGRRPEACLADVLQGHHGDVSPGLWADVVRVVKAEHAAEDWPRRRDERKRKAAAERRRRNGPAQPGFRVPLTTVPQRASRARGARPEPRPSPMGFGSYDDGQTRHATCKQGP